MAHSKYKGGSVLTSFRLPLLHFKEAKQGIEAYLARFKDGKPSGLHDVYPFTPGEVYPPEIKVSSDQAVSVAVLLGFDGSIEYSCGCIQDKLLFRRDSKCDLQIEKHLK